MLHTLFINLLKNHSMHICIVDLYNIQKISISYSEHFVFFTSVCFILIVGIC